MDPQRINLYAYCRNNPVQYVDSNGEDFRLANAAARARIRQVVAPGLTKAEQGNLRVAGGKLTLRNPNAINPSTASPGYRNLHEAITNPDLTINYYAVGKGKTVTLSDQTKVTYDDLNKKVGGVTTGEPGDKTRDIAVPVGGGPDVAGTTPGVKVPFPEDTVFQHELGHGLGKDAVALENEYRESRNPPLEPRSGDDHEYKVTVVGPTDQIVPVYHHPPSTISPRPE